MTALLVAVTFGALGLAGALLFYVLRLTREERDRSDAQGGRADGTDRRRRFGHVERDGGARRHRRCADVWQRGHRRPTRSARLDAGAGHRRAGRRAGADGDLRVEPSARCHGRGAGGFCAARTGLVAARAPGRYADRVGAGAQPARRADDHGAVGGGLHLRSPGHVSRQRPRPAGLPATGCRRRVAVCDLRAAVGGRRAAIVSASVPRTAWCHTSTAANRWRFLR